METIEGGNYSREETICGNTVFKVLNSLRIIWADINEKPASILLHKFHFLIQFLVLFDSQSA